MQQEKELGLQVEETIGSKEKEGTIVLVFKENKCSRLREGLL